MTGAEPAPSRNTRFRVGVNYWPARTAMAWWSSFDPDEVAADFARIAASRSRLGPALPDLGGVPAVPGHGRPADARAARQPLPTSPAGPGLAVMPTLFTGHMSGVNLDPAVGPGRIGAERSLSRSFRRHGHESRTAQLVRRRGGRRGAGVARRRGRRRARRPRRALGLGPRQRELELRRSRRIGPPPKRWLDQITAAIRRADPAALITTGLHMEDLEEDRKLGPCGSRAVVRSPLDARLPDLRRLGRERHRRAAAAVPRRRHPLAR